MEKIEFRKVRDFSAILNSTFEFIRQNFKILLKSSIFIAGPFILLAGIFGGVYQSRAFKFKPDASPADFLIPFSLYLISLFFAIIILIIVIYSIIQIYLESDSLEIEMDVVWSKVKQNSVMIIATSFGLGVIVTVGTMFLIVPGIFLGVALSIIYMVRIVERKKFFESVSRCFYLIKNNWWFTFGLLIVLSIIQGFLSFIFYIPSYIVMFFSAISGFNYDGQGGNGVSEILFIITTIISSLVLIFYTISVVGIAFQYFNLVERKEATGLLSKIDSIQV